MIALQRGCGVERGEACQCNSGAIPAPAEQALWRLYLTAPLVPLRGIVSWLRSGEPGAGPQAGEAAFLVIVRFVLMCLPASLANLLRAAGVNRRMTAGQAARTVLLWLTFWIDCLVLLVRRADLAAGVNATARVRGLATVTSAALGLLLDLGNLWLVARAGRAPPP